VKTNRPISQALTFLSAILLCAVVPIFIRATPRWILPLNVQRSDEQRIKDLIYDAIIGKLGLPWREGGADDLGYDCSGLIWRVFTEAGVSLKRVNTKTLWDELPEAGIDERGEFGTLVFFNDLSHVGIVRDRWSFYHASSSLGVTRSLYTEYWGERITGYRKIPIASTNRVIRQQNKPVPTRH